MDKNQTTRVQFKSPLYDFPRIDGRLVNSASEEVFDGKNNVSAVKIGNLENFLFQICHADGKIFDHVFRSTNGRSSNKLFLQLPFRNFCSCEQLSNFRRPQSVHLLQIFSLCVKQPPKTTKVLKQISGKGNGIFPFYSDSKKNSHQSCIRNKFRPFIQKDFPGSFRFGPAYYPFRLLL